jgi:hypothetical protein
MNKRNNVFATARPINHEGARRIFTKAHEGNRNLWCAFAISFV